MNKRHQWPLFFFGVTACIFLNLAGSKSSQLTEWEKENQGVESFFELRSNMPCLIRNKMLGIVQHWHGKRFIPLPILIWMPIMVWQSIPVIL